MNDNIPEPTPFDEVLDRMRAQRDDTLQGAKTGDIYTHLDGSRWEVIGFMQHPTVVLIREGTDTMPLNHRDLIHIVPSSRVADEWHNLGDFDPNDPEAAA